MSAAAKPAKPKPTPARPAAVRQPGWFERLKAFRFGAREASATPAPKASAKTPKAAAKGQAHEMPSDGMTRALKRVLDRHAASRSVLVHLALVEQALEREGALGLTCVPTDVLARALSQLETLVTDWSQGDLAGLRSQLKSALLQPRPAAVRRDGAARGAALQEGQPEVDEASVSVFMEARARWERSLTGGR